MECCWSISSAGAAFLKKKSALLSAASVQMWLVGGHSFLADAIVLLCKCGFVPAFSSDRRALLCFATFSSLFYSSFLTYSLLFPHLFTTFPSLTFYFFLTSILLFYSLAAFSFFGVILSSFGLVVDIPFPHLHSSFFLTCIFLFWRDQVLACWWMGSVTDIETALSSIC